MDSSLEGNFRGKREGRNLHIVMRKNIQREKEMKSEKFWAKS